MKNKLSKSFLGALTLAVTFLPPTLAASLSGTITSDLAAVDLSSSCSEADVLKLPVYKWIPEHKARGAVVIVHGLMQNGESVSPLAKHLAGQGFLVYTIDQRGHGFWRFANESGAPGYKIDYKQTVKDMRNLSKLIRQEHPDLPLFCVGESAGSAVCVHSVAESPKLFDGVVLCGIGTKTAPLRVKWVASDLLRDSYRWDHPISMERYEDCYTSEDGRTVVETLSDPFCRPTLSAREVLRTVALMRGMKKMAPKLPANVPMLVVEGACDKTMNPKSASTFVALAGSKHKRLIMVPGSGHVLIGTSYLKPIVTHSIDNFLNSKALPIADTDQRIAAKP